MGKIHGGFSVDSFDAFAPANIWFITVTSTAGFKRPETAMAHYRKMHFDFLKQLLGDHLGRKLHRQPFGYAFIDFASSKEGATKVRVRPHVHAVLMIHPETAERLADIGPEVRLFEKAKRFDPVKHGPMLNMAAYAMKGAVGHHGFHADEDCASLARLLLDARS